MKHGSFVIKMNKGNETKDKRILVTERLTWIMMVIPGVFVPPFSLCSHAVIM